MIRVGLISVSDGRTRVHQGLLPELMRQQRRLAERLTGFHGCQVVEAACAVSDPRQAVEQGKRLAAQDLDALIISVPVFAFPNYSALIYAMQCAPVCLIAPINGALPGLGGLQAASNMIRQSGGCCEKIWGDVEDPAVARRLTAFLKAAHAKMRLRGQVYGLVGGRSIGMGSGVAPQDLWMNKFQVDVEQVDQLEIVRRAQLAGADEVERALDWLASRVGRIAYDGDKLTPDSLRRQIRCYIATRQIVEDYRLDFIGVKCHYELSEYQVTQCLSAALFNDPYDWNGAHRPVVFSCEADSDGALTMQMMRLVSGLPVLFADFRHYDPADGLFAFCNCGAMATWYARRADAPEDNLREVTLCPVIPKYGGQGCHVQFTARQGPVTVARFSRVMDQYKLTAFRGEIVEAAPEKLKMTSEAWPHAFMRLPGDPYQLVERYDSNHVHAVYGDHLEELAAFCRMTGVAFERVE